MHTIEFYASMYKCLLVYGLIHSSLPYKQRKNLYTNKRSSIKATSNSKSRAIEIAAKYRMFTARSLSSWVVLSSTTDLLILRHKIDYVTSLSVDFRREYHKNSVLPPLSYIIPWRSGSAWKSVAKNMADFGLCWRHLVPTATGIYHWPTAMLFFWQSPLPPWFLQKNLWLSCFRDKVFEKNLFFFACGRRNL